MIISRTPYRISFFGGGTDYPDWFKNEGGAVLSTSIDKYCYITCRNLPPFFSSRHRVVWSEIELISNVGEIKHPAIRECLRHYFGDEIDGIEIHHQGDLPARSGIGSSSSFSVGLIKALYAWKNRVINPQDNANEAIRLEQFILKENVGCQDQIAAAYGGFNRIEFKKNGEFVVQPVICQNERLAELNSRLHLYFTGTTRIASQIAGDIISNVNSKQSHLRRMREMVEEGMKILCSEQNLDDFGKLLDEAWQQKKFLSKLVSTPEIDEIYAAAKFSGALGGKLLGAGSAGFMLFYVPHEHAQRFKEQMASLLHIPFRFDSTGSVIMHHSR